MDFVHKGNELFIEENYVEACQEYTKAVAKMMGKEQFGALFGRGRALMHLNKHYNAIRDFGECLSFDHQHQLTNYYLGICLIKIGKHDLEKMKQCHKYLLIAQNGSSKQSRFEKAVEKSIKLLQKLQPKIEISENSDNINNNNNEEKTDNIDNNDKIDNDGDIELKSNESKPNESKPDESKPNTEKKKEKNSKKEKGEIIKPKIRENWYQSASNITFTLYIKNLTENDVSIKYSSKLVVIELKLKDGSKYTRNIQLKNEIFADKCSYTINAYKIIITLIKSSVGEWDVLEHIIDDGKHHSMISAPWTTKRDWNKMDKFAKQELEKEKPEGDEALQSLFSKIYGDADDDQKRAMIKSFQTSGGTVLSTNWKDVKSKDYEGKDKVLPTGQNKHKWEY